jgi:hypothetical protein
VSVRKNNHNLYDQNIDTDQLILWTILKQEHPSLAEYFWNNPEKIGDVLSYTDTSKPFTYIKDYDDLLSRREIKDFLIMG